MDAEEIGAAAAAAELNIVGGLALTKGSERELRDRPPATVSR